MFVKLVNIEGIFNFTFGTGKDDNLIVNLIELIDSKMYAGGDNSGDDGRSSDDLDVRPEPSTSSTRKPPRLRILQLESIIVVHIAGGRVSMSWIRYNITHAPFAIDSRILTSHASFHP